MGGLRNACTCRLSLNNADSPHERRLLCVDAVSKKRRTLAKAFQVHQYHFSVDRNENLLSTILYYFTWSVISEGWSIVVLRCQNSTSQGFFSSHKAVKVYWHKLILLSNSMNALPSVASHLNAFVIEQQIIFDGKCNFREDMNAPNNTV